MTQDSLRSGPAVLVLAAWAPSLAQRDFVLLHAGRGLCHTPPMAGVNGGTV